MLLIFNCTLKTVEFTCVLEVLEDLLRQRSRHVHEVGGGVGYIKKVLLGGSNLLIVLTNLMGYFKFQALH